MAFDFGTLAEILVATASLVLALVSLRLAKLAKKEEEGEDRKGNKHFADYYQSPPFGLEIAEK